MTFVGFPACGNGGAPSSQNPSSRSSLCCPHPSLNSFSCRACPLKFKPRFVLSLQPEVSSCLGKAMPLSPFCLQHSAIVEHRLKQYKMLLQQLWFSCLLCLENYDKPFMCSETVWHLSLELNKSLFSVDALSSRRPWEIIVSHSDTLPSTALAFDKHQIGVLGERSKWGLW